MGIVSNLFGGRLNVVRLNNGDYEYSNVNGNWSKGDLLQLALSSDIVTTCIGIRAHYRSLVKYVENDAKGKPIKDSKIVNFLNNPNPYQTKSDFIKQEEWLRICYGYLYQKIYDDIGGDLPRVIYNLNPCNVTFNKQSFLRTIFHKKNDLRDSQKKDFKYKDNNHEFTFSIDEVVKYYDIANGLEENPFTSPSRLMSIRKRIDNLNNSVVAEGKAIDSAGREIIMKDKDQNQIKNGLPMDNQDKRNAENAFVNNYGLGLGKNRTVVMNNRVEWLSMLEDHKKLGMTEILNNNVSVILNAFNIPKEIYQLYKDGGAKFENKKQSELSFIQNVIQPLENEKVEKYSAKYGVNLEASFKHLPCFQEIENTKVDRLLKVSNAIRNLTQAGFNANEANNFLESHGLQQIKDNG